MIRRRILRDYRGTRTPTKFLNGCKKVQHGMTDNPNCPESLKPLVEKFSYKVNALDLSYHAALDGSRTDIRERESISDELVLLMDQLAAGLEAACVLNPDALLTTGFNISQERRSPARVRLPLVSPVDFSVSNLGDPGKALATGSNCPSALIHEIHINQKDPSVEEDWFHKSNFSDPLAMPMDGIPPGQTFFRMRHFGPDGPGPWSAVVSTMIT
ncbi:hypothetical protein GMSM_20180 [Geomonas sp. Red276]